MAKVHRVGLEALGYQGDWESGIVGLGEQEGRAGRQGNCGAQAGKAVELDTVEKREH